MNHNIKSWFAAQIFQQGQRVVMTKYCPQLTPSDALSIVRVGLVCEAPDPDDRKRECGGMVCHVDFGGDPEDRRSERNYGFTHCCTCELELFDVST